jgi:hypothetical protein
VASAIYLTALSPSVSKNSLLRTGSAKSARARSESNFVTAATTKVSPNSRKKFYTRNSFSFRDQIIANSWIPVATIY